MTSTPFPPAGERRRAYSLRGITTLVLVLALTGAACGSANVLGAGADEHAASDDRADPVRGFDRIDPTEFRQDMRRLWVDHVTWTRLYIVSALAGLPDLDATAGRLLQNQAEIGDAVAVFYGDEAGAALTSLLREHILIAGALVAAAKAGDTDAVATQSALWYTNADEIAEFLAGANPAWQVEVLREMMRMHLDQTLAEAAARLAGDWEADIAEYDRIVLHILEMADLLADGVVDQFPRRFSH